MAYIVLWGTFLTLNLNGSWETPGLSLDRRCSAVRWLYRFYRWFKAVLIPMLRMQKLVTKGTTANIWWGLGSDENIWKLDSEKIETILLKKTWCCELMAIGIGSFLSFSRHDSVTLVFCWFSAPKLQRPRPVPRERRRSVHNKSCTFGAWSPGPIRPW